MKIRWILTITILFVSLGSSVLLAQENRALSLDGNGDYVAIPMSLGSIVTIEVWATVNDADSRMLWCIDNDNKGPDLNFASGLILLNTWDGLSNPFCNIPNNANEWHHYAVVIESVNTVLYIDGFLRGIAAYRNPSGTSFYISSGAGYDWNGYIDEVRIWNIARTQEEIQTTMYTELQGDEEGLVAYYRFNTLEDLDIGEEGFKVDDVRDWSGNGNHGDLVGDALLVDSTAPIDVMVIAGIVSGAENGAGLSDALVELLDDNETVAASTSTAANGYYRFADIPEGQYQIRASKLFYYGTVSEEFNITPQEVKYVDLTIQPEQRQYALSLDGSGDYVDCGQVLTGSGAFTAEAWINPTGSSEWNTIIAEGCTGFDLAIDEETILFGRNCGGTDGVFYYGPSVALNQWIHVAIVYDGTNLDLHTNGVKTIGGPVTYTHANLYIGSYNGISELFHGIIDEVRIWNIARAQEEIQRDMRSRLTGDEPGLIGYWTFDGKNAVDKSGNGNDGTLMGDAQIIPLDWAPIVVPTEFKARIPLTRGINMISLPLSPAIPYTASTLADALNSTIVIQVEDGHFDAYVHRGSIGNDFDIKMGNGYIVNLIEAQTFDIIGKPWGEPVPAVPSRSLGDFGYIPSTPWAFVIAGKLDGPVPDNRCLRVTNLHTGEKLVASISPSGEFTAAFVDLNQRPVIAVGDEIAVQLFGRGDVSLTEAKRYIISHEQIANAYLLVHFSAEPEQTRLLQNYPNPFNPETWIPFQLARPADVTIQIYNARGQLVRTLSLGQHNAGFYLNRSKAACWNGRNISGERVASGLYFYQLQAGDFTAIRRMVIIK